MNIKTLSAITLTASLLLAGSAGAASTDLIKIDSIVMADGTEATYHEGMLITSKTITVKGTAASSVKRFAIIKTEDGANCNFPSNAGVVYQGGTLPTVAQLQAAWPAACVPLFTVTGAQQQFFSAYQWNVRQNWDATGKFSQAVTLSDAALNNGLSLKIELDGAQGCPDVNTCWFPGGYPVTSSPFHFDDYNLQYPQKLGAAIANVGNSLAAYTLNATFYPVASEVGQVRNLYVAALLPDGALYFLNAAGNWAHWDGLADTPYRANATLTGSQTLAIVPTAGDYTSITGTKVYVGYGQNMADVINKTQFERIQTLH